jgi:hypothetical protein
MDILLLTQLLNRSYMQCPKSFKGSSRSSSLEVQPLLSLLPFLLSNSTQQRSPMAFVVLGIFAIAGAIYGTVCGVVRVRGYPKT